MGTVWRTNRLHQRSTRGSLPRSRLLRINFMRATILGASGLLGKALMHEWNQDAVTGLSSSVVDIRDEKLVQAKMQDLRPDWIVLAAAYADGDGCEGNPEKAFSVNRDGGANVGGAG